MEGDATTEAEIRDHVARRIGNLARPQLVVISLPSDGSLPSTATLLPVTGDMAQTPGANLNGIVAKSGVLEAVAACPLGRPPGAAR